MHVFSWFLGSDDLPRQRQAEQRQQPGGLGRRALALRGFWAVLCAVLCATGCQLLVRGGASKALEHVVMQDLGLLCLVLGSEPGNFACGASEADGRRQRRLG